MSLDVARANVILTNFRSVALSRPKSPTILELSGYPHYENVCSNILAFYFDPSGVHGLGSLCLDALFSVACPGVPVPILSNVKAEREVVTGQGNRIDLIVSTDSHLILIENKIYAGASNPFSDYADHMRDNGAQRAQLKVLLAIYPPRESPGHGFVTVSHADFREAMRSRLGFHTPKADSRYLMFFIDFLNTLENLEQGTQMDPSFINFISQQGGDLEALMGQLKAFKIELRSRVTELASMIDASHDGVRQIFWRESESLFDILVYDIAMEADFVIAIDAKLSAQGWSFEIFDRKRKALEKVRGVLQTQGIPFIEANGQLIYAQRFSYVEPMNVVQEHLQLLVNKIAAARTLSAV